MEWRVEFVLSEYMPECAKELQLDHSEGCLDGRIEARGIRRPSTRTDGAGMESVLSLGAHAAAQIALLGGEPLTTQPAV